MQVLKCTDLNKRQQLGPLSLVPVLPGGLCLQAVPRVSSASTPWLLVPAPVHPHSESFQAQEPGLKELGIPGFALDGWRSSSFHPPGLDLLLHIAFSSLKFPLCAMKFLLLLHFHLVGTGAARWAESANAIPLGKRKKSALTFRQR